MAWTNQDLILYHGTSDSHMPSIRRGLSLSISSPVADFGPGFYTTTYLEQARLWAKEKVRRNRARGLKGNSLQPTLLQFSVPRQEFSRLKILCFVRSNPEAEDYWTFVSHCRNKNGYHWRQSEHEPAFYDVVAGPVASNWKRRAAIAGFDQFSFHTLAAIGLLNESISWHE